MISKIKKFDIVFFSYEYIYFRYISGLLYFHSFYFLIFTFEFLFCCTVFTTNTWYSF